MLFFFRKHKFEWQEIYIFNLVFVTVIKKTADENSEF